MLNSRDLTRISVIALAMGLCSDRASAIQAGDRDLSSDGIWARYELEGRVAAEPEPWVRPDAFRLFSLNDGPVTALLAQADPEDGRPVGGDASRITIPMPDGSFARFRFWESSVMAPALAARYPQIKTYAGQGIDDPAATVHFDRTPAGFHAQILSPTGAVYVDPYWRGDTTVHASYFKHDYQKPGAFACLFENEDQPQAGTVAAVAAPSGDTLRTYRLACAATGEYTQFHGGTVAAGLAAVVTTINRVTGIYEVELAIRMQLVANNDQLIFTDGATDPYSNSDGFSMLGQNQATITSVIGSAGYDIGHVFSTGGGGVAVLGVVCSNSSKARGVTGLPSPIGDPFAVDFVAHEMGHQFRGNHTFNGVNQNCSGGNRNGSTAYEPGSGSTIQAYAGICGVDDLQPHSDPYFHAESFDEMRSFVSGFGGSCATITQTGNDPPIVDAGPDVTIPRNTPFLLTATANDLNGDALTYCWEERDLGPAVPLSAPDDGQIPLFRSLLPTTNPARSFPRMESIVSGMLTADEKLPVKARDFIFRATVRDNRAGGGGVDWDERVITVDEGSGPFRVSVEDGPGGDPLLRTVTWTVAGTDVAPVNTTHVNIVMSTDNGATFPLELEGNTLNDGSEVITLPGGQELGLIKVEAVGNVFFGIAGVCAPPSPVDPGPNAFSRNRYITFTAPPSGPSQAVRITFLDLPAPFDALNGTTRWVAAPTDVSERPGKDDATPPTFKAATLDCDPVFADWGTLGSVHVSDPNIVPGGTYDVQIVDLGCDPTAEASFSAPLRLEMSRWGDAVGAFDKATGMWTAPDNRIDVAFDVVGTLDKFAARPNAPAKSRVDFEPATPDRKITIIDVTSALDAFSGRRYPFSPDRSACP